MWQSCRDISINMKIQFRLIISYLLIILFSQLSVASTYKETITINNFKTGDFDYVIVGEKAVITGSHVHLNGVQARLKQSTGEIYLFTPECEFDQEKRIGYSDKSVHIRNESMTIDGDGFELNINKNKVIVRKKCKSSHLQLSERFIRTIKIYYLWCITNQPAFCINVLL